MKSYSYYGQTLAGVPARSVTPAMQSADVWIGCGILTFPLMLVLAILSYRQRRARLLQLQILRLEKLWNLSTGQDSMKE